MDEKILNADSQSHRVTFYLKSGNSFTVMLTKLVARYTPLSHQLTGLDFEFEREQPHIFHMLIDQIEAIIVEDDSVDTRASS